jgi:hypothetical protein
MKLPNSEQAVVDMRKIRDYCLSLDHPQGRHKARVFSSALELTADNSEELQAALLSAARTGEAVPTEQDQFGQRYVLDFRMNRKARRAWIRSSWIVRREEDFPRFLSCYVL